MALRIGIIACGKVSERVHLPAYKEIRGVSVVAACDINLKRGKWFAKKFDIPHMYGTYEEMLANEELDAVSVNSPHRFHAEHTIAAAKAGCHVLVEKPMALSIKDIRAMIATCKKAKKILMVEQFQRFTPMVYKAHQIISSGKLGKVYTIRGHFGHGGPEYWSPEGKWFLQKKEAQGGTMLDIGVHQIDMMRYISGKEVTEISAFFGTLQKKIDVEDNGVALLRFNDGTIGTFEASWTNIPGIWHTEFYCEKGCLLLHASSEHPLTIRRPDRPPKPVRLPAKHPDKSAMGYFVKCIQQGRIEHCDGEDAGKSSAVVLTAAISAREKRTVKVPMR
ncbi:MAG: Gfo/Idh/MocA family oxidoreductase [bacterium]